MRWSTKSDDELNRLLNDLQLGEFIYEQPAVGDTEYIFKHALTQEVAYNSVLMERRQQLHERTAAALETLYASTVEEHLAELAHHYGRSANPDKAVEYLTRAGQQALNRSAFAEAQAQLQQGLEWIKKLRGIAGARRARAGAGEHPRAGAAGHARVHRAGDARGRRARPRPGREGRQPGPTGCHRCSGFGVAFLPRAITPLPRLLADRILDLAQREGSPASFGFAYACSGGRELLSRRPRRRRGALRALERLP